MPLVTRKPTGLPSWPIGLIAGVEKSGKSYVAAKTSGSTMIHRTFWIGCGEDDPDEYAIIPDTRFEIVPHNGTWRDMMMKLQEAREEPAGPNGEPNLIVFDSGSRLWAQLSDEAQKTANERQRKRNKSIPDEGVPISMDLWNSAKDRWGDIINQLRAHNGPSLITSRLDLITIMDEAGKPTKEKQWKVLSEKNLPYEVGFVVQMRASFPESDTWLTGVKSARYVHEKDPRTGKAKLTALPDDWSVESLWQQFGLSGPVGERAHATAVSQTAGEEADVLEGFVERARQGWENADLLRALYDEVNDAGYGGETVKGPGGKEMYLAELIRQGAVAATPPEAEKVE